MAKSTNSKRSRLRPRNTGRRSGGNNSRGVFDSNGPETRVRGTAQQVFDKYLTLARDAAGSGDRVLAENLLQHADHYYRVIHGNDPAPRSQARDDAQDYVAPDEAEQDDDFDDEADDNGSDESISHNAAKSSRHNPLSSSLDDSDAPLPTGPRHLRQGPVDNFGPVVFGEPAKESPSEERKPARRPRRRVAQRKDAEGEETTQPPETASA